MTLIVSRQGSTVRVPRQPFENEQALQQFIYHNPEAIPLDEVAPGTRLFVLGRECPTDSGPIDALAIDQAGHPFIIETKRYKNPDKREVVAQVLDYAAALWSNPPTTEWLVDWMIKDSRKRNAPDPLERLSTFLTQDEASPQTTLAATATALGEGSFTAVVLMDALSDRLRDLVQFLNEKSDFRILAVELDYYRHDGAEIAVPRIFGAEARRGSPARAAHKAADPAVAMKQWREEFGSDAADGWQAFVATVLAAEIPGLELAYYPSGLQYLLLAHTRIGTVRVLRLSHRFGGARDELHTNVTGFTSDPVANEARERFRSTLASVPGAADTGTSGRISIPAGSLPGASAEITAAMVRLARELA